MGRTVAAAAGAAAAAVSHAPCIYNGYRCLLSMTEYIISYSYSSVATLNSIAALPQSCR